MSTKKPKPAKKTFSKVYRFAQEEGVRVSLEEDAFQHLCTFARMFMSDDPELRAVGRARLHEVAKALSTAQNEKLRASVANRPNAQQARPMARVTEPDTEDEIVKEFKRLRREGHSTGNARGLMKSWGKWSQSTIYRRTKEEK